LLKKVDLCLVIKTHLLLLWNALILQILELMVLPQPPNLRIIRHLHLNLMFLMVLMGRNIG